MSYWSDNQVAMEDGALFSFTKDTLWTGGNIIGLLKCYEWGDFQARMLIPLKHNFNYENQHLSNSFASCYNLNKSTQIIVNQEDGCRIYRSDGSYLLSLVFDGDEYQSNILLVLIIVFYILAYSFLILLMLELYRLFPGFQKRPILRMGLFSLDVIILWVILKWIGTPEILLDSRFFDPALFAHNAVISNLADLVLASVGLLLTGYAWYTELVNYSPIDKNKTSFNKLIQSLGIIIISIFVSFTIVLIYSLVIDSTISFDLGSILILDQYSITGFIIIAFLLLSGWLILSSYVGLMVSCGLRIPKMIILLLVTSLVQLLFGFVLYPDYPLFVSLLGIIYVVVFTFREYFQGSHRGPGKIVTVIMVFSLLSGYLLYRGGAVKEDAEMRMLAMSLSHQRDRIAEFMFEEQAQAMEQDTELRRLAHRAVYNYEQEEELEKYLKDNYLSGYWKQFEYQFTVCDPFVDLTLGGAGHVVNCNAYFNDILQRYGEETYGDHLYFINDSSGMVTYLGEILLPPGGRRNDSVRLYIDIIPRYIQEGLGYPELMIDEQFNTMVDYAGYSWALFLDGSLVRNVGDYFYSSKLARYEINTAEDLFFDHNGFHHFMFHSAEGNVLVVSKPQHRVIDIIAPFSYLFLCFSVVFALLYCVYFFTRRNNILQLTTRNRLQVFVTGFLFLSLAVVGYSSVRYLLIFNSDKNREALQEKAHSVLTELEHKLGDEETFDESLFEYLNALFAKWSNVFFSDINLYSPDGRLLVSSRHAIFDENLTSRRMDAAAYRALALERKTQFIGEERIGSYTYLSAWVQFRNADNELIAYLNLPFFARQSELSMQISAFLTTFINIYVLLIVIALLLGLLLSNIISKPLDRIRGKMAALSLGSDNEKLEWSRDDEIGALVKEYNAKVDELARNAAKLAQTEREGAWREMARQVAHEIKNPLTPMKLLVQHLERAWEDKAPDWDVRLKRFTITMTEQIDAMAEIATAFSDFAKMPRAQSEIISLNELILATKELYKDTPELDIHTELTPYDTSVFADQRQMLRVFNNLMKNAVQALEDTPDAKISVETWIEDDSVVIMFADNGPGIPEGQADRIFAPNFTTKSGGMGLGLAMAKNIVQNSGGSIWLDASHVKGTVFYIRMPQHREGR